MPLEDSHFGRRDEDHGKDSPQTVLALIHRDVLDLAKGAIEVKTNLESYREKFELEIEKHKAEDDQRFSKLADTLQINQLSVSNDMKEMSKSINQGLGAVKVTGFILTLIVAILGVFVVIRFH